MVDGLTLLGLAYVFAKDLIRGYSIEDKQVGTLSWLENHPYLKQHLENLGYQLRWVSLRRKESMKLEGYEEVYEFNKNEKKYYRIIATDTILMGKKTNQG